MKTKKKKLEVKVLAKVFITQNELIVSSRGYIIIISYREDSQTHIIIVALAAHARKIFRDGFL